MTVTGYTRAQMDAFLVAQNAPLIAGRYYTCPAPNVSTLLLTGDRLYLAPFPVGRTATLDRIGLEVTTVGTSGAVIRLGAYLLNADGSATLLVDGGTISGTSATAQEKTISTAVSIGQTILLGAVSQGSPATPATVRALGGMTMPNGFSATSLAGIAANTFGGFTVNSVSGALPSTIALASMSTANTLPRMIVRAA